MLNMDLYRSSRYPRGKKYIHVGNYQYCEKDVLGQGYSSKVFRGIEKDSKKQVAVKIINPQILSQQINVLLLQSELKMLEYVKGCENVLEVYEIIKQEQKTFIITEVCQTDISQMLEPKMSLSKAEKYIYQLLHGFKQLFRKSIVHRDLKPANLFIDSNDNLKIGDFGFAIKTQEARFQTRYNIGSPLYMSPEALRSNQYSHKSDVWAIGIIIYQILTGDTPWQAQNEDELYQKLLETPIEDILKNDTFPDHIKDILTLTLQFQKSKRISPEQLILLGVRNKLIYQQKRQKILNQSKSTKNILHSVQKTKNTRTQKFHKNSPSKLKKPLGNFVDDLLSHCREDRNNRRRNTHLLQVPDKKDSQVQTKGSTTVTMEEIQMPKLTREETKKITSNLVQYVNTFRLLYKILVRFDECIENNFNNKVISHLSELRSQLFSEYCNIIVTYCHKIKNLPINNFLDLPKENLIEYTSGSDFKKLKKATTDYISKYSKSSELSEFWHSSHEPNYNRASILTSEAVCHIWLQLCQKNYQEIILIQFMVYAKEVLEALNKGSFSFVANQHEIEKYVDTIPNPPNFQRFRQAIAKAKQIAQQKSDRQRTKQEARS